MQFWKVKLLTYLHGVFLYRWYALALAWVLCLGGWAWVAAMPDQYRAEARVYIDTNNIMDPLLRGMTVSNDTNQEIAVMLRTLITRPTLEQVLHLTNPKSNSFNAAETELAVSGLQNQISIRQLETRNYFAIGYANTDSDYATSVTQTLLSILQDNRVGGSRLDMDVARSFINKKIEEYEQRLRDADKRRADFRTANVTILSKGTAADRIDAATAELEQDKRDLEAIVARRDSIKAQLAETPQTVPVDERMFGGGAAIAQRTGAGGTPFVTNAMQRMQQAQANLDELRTRYTEQHPDVLALKRLIAQLKAQVEASPERNPDVMTPNPVYAQLQGKLADEETNVAVQSTRISAANVKLAQAKRESAQAIATLTTFNQLDRDYGNIEKTYQELLQTRETASLSQARDDQNQGVSFRILDPPQKPRFPSAPNRLILNSMVLVFGLGGGAFLAVLLTLNSGRFMTSDDVGAHFDLPLIGVITELPQPDGTRRSQLSLLALSTGIGALFVTYAGVVLLIKTSLYPFLVKFYG